MFSKCLTFLSITRLLFPFSLYSTSKDSSFSLICSFLLVCVVFILLLAFMVSFSVCLFVSLTTNSSKQNTFLIVFSLRVFTISSLFCLAFGLIWFGCVLWHINHCCLFNAKSCFYVTMKCIWFINTSNTIYSIYYFFYLTTVKWVQLFLFSITNQRSVIS